MSESTASGDTVAANGSVEVRRIAFELTIDATRRTVWDVMVKDIGEWWPADYRATSDAVAFHFEAHPGGRV